MLIGVTGYAQHGKDTIAHTLVRDFGYTRVAFADPLKELAYRLNPFLNGIGRLQSIVDMEGWESAKEYPEVRRLLQVLGTEARDIIGPNVWVDAADRSVLSVPGPVVLSDVRFPNEAEYVHRHGGMLLRVTRPGFDNGIGTDHPSEAHVASLPADHEIINLAPTATDFRVELRAQLGRLLGRVPSWASND